MTKALIILAEGFEELEAVTVMDLFVRADIEVLRGGLSAGPIKASRGTVILPDCHLDEVRNQDFDVVVLPGGQPGANTLAESPDVLDIVRRQVQADRLMAAICAAPKVLVAAGVAKGKSITCYPGALNASSAPDSQLTGESLTDDPPLLTSRGPGTAIEFALAIIEKLKGEDIKREVEIALAGT